MKCEDGKLPTAWTIKPLGTMCEVVRGGSPRPIMNYLTTSPTGVNWLKIGDVGETDKYFTRAAERIKLEGTTKSRKVERGDLLLSNSMSFGRAFITLIDGYIHDGWLRLRSDERVLDKEYLYYFLLSPFAQNQFKSVATGSVVANLKSETVKALEVLLPPLPEQKRIAAILSSLDDKIEQNNKINANLEQQAQALFKAWFVDFKPFGGKMPKDWRIDSAECFYNIGIGKTPPRVEAQWFTKNRNGIVWVSITDMGKSGLFIGDSDEYLTEEAVERFNVKVIPENTVILSFKLTVGRVCITAEKVTTNEAIAHFGMGPENSLEYLYCYLKNFDYGTLGNTSSIALAVNSKTIKKMPIVMPDRKTLMEFHLIVGSLFNRIKLNISENASLATLRDALLPRLMSGQIEL